MSNTKKSAVSSDGTEISYIESGTGPELVITHGSIALKEQWSFAVNELKKDFTCFSYDRRGRGDSGDSSDYTIQSEVEDLHAVLNAAGENATILAHSFGALCALEYALKYGLDNRKLILFEPPLPVTEPVAGEPLKEYARLIDSGETEAALKFGLKKFVRAIDEEIEKMAHSPAWAQLVDLAPTWVRELREIDALGNDISRYSVLSGKNVSLLVGASTTEFLKASAQALDQSIEDLHVIEMPGLDHFAHVIDPSKFSEYVQEAFQGTEG